MAVFIYIPRRHDNTPFSHSPMLLKNNFSTIFFFLLLNFQIIPTEWYVLFFILSVSILWANRQTCKRTKNIINLEVYQMNQECEIKHNIIGFCDKNKLENQHHPWIRLENMSGIFIFVWPYSRKRVLLNYQRICVLYELKVACLGYNIFVMLWNLIWEILSSLILEFLLIYSYCKRL